MDNTTNKTNYSHNFKSERAAKMAYTKQEKVYEAARNTVNQIRHDRPDGVPTTEEIAKLNRLQAEYKAITSSDERYQSKAWNNYCDLEHEINNRPLKNAEAAADAAFAKLAAIYDQATAQGFWIKSWHFGHNPTRDLIAANMD